MTTKLYKTYDYQIGAGFQYQWWIATFLYLSLNQRIHLKSTLFKDIYSNLEKHSSFLGRPLIEGKIFLEGNLNCFDDINILFDGEKVDNYLFLQVKGQKESENPDYLQNEKIYHAVTNYINNLNNIPSESNSRLIIICSKKVNPLIKKMLSGNGDDIEVREERIIFFLRKEFPKCSIRTGQKIIEVLFGRKSYTVDHNMLAYAMRINDSLKNVKVIESVSREDLENELFSLVDEGELLKLKNRVEKLSVDITPISPSESEFEIYKSYVYTQFKPGKTIDVLDSIDSPKFLD